MMREEAMLSEQKNVVQAFREAHQDNEKIVIYGTGINAEAVVKNCTDFQLIGLMDVAKTGENLWGLPVLSEEEIVSFGVQKIVIVARPAVHFIIYKRIEQFVKKNNISVYDIYGNDISQKGNGVIQELDYFHVSYQDLFAQIQRYEVISFDIFDTLLCRRVYQPQDVFALMESDDILKDFFRIRESAEEILNCEADIYEIYEYIRECSHLTKDEANELLSREIQKEKQVLCVRERMVECLRQCVQMGKQIYLVSDMYMPRKILEEILRENGIVEYQELFVSCEYKVSKVNGLFKVLKSHVGNKTCLHIGDNHERDYLCALNAGIDAFEIASPIKMMEMSTYQSWLSYTHSLENRLILGMLASKIFNDPFSLNESKGKPCVDKNYDFAYLYIAPLVVAFMSWMITLLLNEKDAIVLFASRDGFLFQKIYQIIKNKVQLANLPEDTYFLISRRAITQTEDESNFEEKKKIYLDYAKKSGLFDKEKVFFVDFMSKGTCQLGLEKIIEIPVYGIYMQKSCGGKQALNQLSVQAFYKETSAMENDKRIFAMCDFLECIFTSFSPSLKSLDMTLGPIFEEEVRTKQQLKMVRELHVAIINFVNEFYDIYSKLATGFRDSNFADEILRGTQREFTRIMLSDMQQMNLDDAYGVCKNTGMDIIQ